MMALILWVPLMSDEEEIFVMLCLCLYLRPLLCVYDMCVSRTSETYIGMIVVTVYNICPQGTCIPKCVSKIIPASGEIRI